MPRPDRGRPAPARLVAEQVQELLRRAAALAGGVTEASGLHPTDVRALRALDAAAAGPLTVGELGRRLGLSSASVTALVDRLAAAGLVHRERDPEDGRRVHVVLTAAARELGRRQLGPLAVGLRRALDRSDDRELKVVQRFLGALLEDEAATPPRSAAAHEQPVADARREQRDAE